MAAKIYDSTSQAFADADTPKVFVNGVATDTEGKLWNTAEQAFTKEAWSADTYPNNLTSYKIAPNRRLDDNMTYMNNSGTVLNNSISLTVNSDKQAHTYGAVVSENVIDFSNYSSLTMVIDFTLNTGWDVMGMIGDDPDFNFTGSTILTANNQPSGGYILSNRSGMGITTSSTETTYTIEFDLSSVTGVKYFYPIVVSCWYQTSSSQYITIKSITFS